MATSTTTATTTTTSSNTSNHDMQDISSSCTCFDPSLMTMMSVGSSTERTAATASSTTATATTTNSNSSSSNNNNNSDNHVSPVVVAVTEDEKVDGVSSLQKRYDNSPKKSLAQKRWAVLRIVTRTGTFMKRSLQAHEHELLHHLNKSPSSTCVVEEAQSSLLGPRTRPHLDHVQECEERRSLNEFLDANQEELHETEVKYFRQLIASPHIPSAHVAQARRSILVHHKAHAHHSTTPLHQKVVQPPEAAAVAPPRDIKHDEVLFRKQVWNTYQALKESQRTDFFREKSVRKQAHSERKAAAAAPDRASALQGQQQNDIGSFFGQLFRDISSGIANNTNKNESVRGNPVDSDGQEEEEDDNGDEEDEPMVYSILGTTPDDVDCAPHVLTPPLMEQLRHKLPTAIQHDHFWLKYSAHRDGFSLRALVHAMRYSSRSILVVETMDAKVLGFFTSSPWTPRGNQYYGTGEAFVFRLKQPRNTTPPSSACEDHQAIIQERIQLESQVEIFPWSGQNHNVQRLERLDRPLILGGGASDSNPNHSIMEAGEDDDTRNGSAVVLLPTLEKGFSHPCRTFHSPELVNTNKAGEPFDIENVEVWTLTPMDTMDQAEKVELGRRFIFDNSDFVQH